MRSLHASLILSLMAWPSHRTQAKVEILTHLALSGHLGDAALSDAVAAAVTVRGSAAEAFVARTVGWAAGGGGWRQRLHDAYLERRAG